MTKLEEIETAILRHPDPVVSVPELAKEIDRSDTHVREKLEQLEYLGRVERKDVGARATAWWHVERVASVQEESDDRPDRSDTPGEESAVGPVRDARGGAGWTVEEAAAHVDLPGRTEDVQEDRREALAAVLRHLRENGPAQAGELESVGFEKATHYETARSFWKNCATNALRDLRDAGAVELVDQARGLWSWNGD